jgi:hypothetical protein
MDLDGAEPAHDAAPQMAGDQAAAKPGQQQPGQQQPGQQQSGFSARVLVDVACPLLTQFILEGGGGDTERAHEKKQMDVDRWAADCGGGAGCGLGLFISLLCLLANHSPWRRPGRQRRLPRGGAGAGPG